MGLSGKSSDGVGNPPKSFSALLGTKGFPTELSTREQYFAKVTENPYFMQENGDIRMEIGKPARARNHALTQNGQQVNILHCLPRGTVLFQRPKERGRCGGGHPEPGVSVPGGTGIKSFYT